MIPRANITAWRAVAPWPSNEQVEQDLVLSRALVAMYGKQVVADRAIFRGGTALHKLFFGAGGRYSELCPVRDYAERPGGWRRRSGWSGVQRSA